MFCTIALPKHSIDQTFPIGVTKFAFACLVAGTRPATRQAKANFVTPMGNVWSMECFGRAMVQNIKLQHANAKPLHEKLRDHSSAYKTDGEAVTWRLLRYLSRAAPDL